MSDVNVEPQTEAAPTRIGGTILVEVSETNIKYDSAMSLPEVVFWLETVKSMIVKKILEG